MSEEDALIMRDWFSANAPRTLELRVSKWSTRLADGCATCVTKHLAQAIELFGEADEIERPRAAKVLVHRAAILLHEAQHGYPGHRYHALGCLAEAENFVTPADARELRMIRLMVAGDLGCRELKSYHDGLFKLLGGTLDEAWAHVSEAFVELPVCDRENRDTLRGLLFGNDNKADLIKKLTQVMKDVVDTYCLPGGDL